MQNDIQNIDTPHSGISKKALTAVSLFLIGFAYALVGLYSLGQHPYLGETDTSFFIEYVMKIKEQGGPLDFVASLFMGKFTPGNQHPLYPFIISLFYSKSIAYFLQIKLLNFFLGLAFLYLFYFLVKKEAGSLVASIAACLLIANDTFMHQTTMVSCETLLVIFTTLSFYLIIRGLDDNRVWIPAGLCVGLAHLTKGSGMFIPFGFLLFLLFDVKFRFWKLFKNKYLWLFALMFMVGALPLLVRNTIVYKFPFYNYNVTYFAMDQDWGKAEKKAEFSDVFKKKPTELAGRFIKGTAREFRILLHSLYSFSLHYVPKLQNDTSPWYAKAMGAVAAGLMFLSAAAGFITSQCGRRKKALILFLVIGFYLPLSWYSITAPNRRYILPVTILFIFFAALFCAQVLRRAVSEQRWVFKKFSDSARSLFPGIALASMLLLFVAIYPAARAIPHPMKTYAYEDGYLELADYLMKNLKPGEKYLKKGEHNYSWVILYPELDAKRDGMKYFKDINAFTGYMQEHKNIAYYLLDQEGFRMTKNIFDKSYINLDPQHGFVLVKNIPGFTAVMQDTMLPSDYILFKRNE